jgi:hypothetical protein
MAGSLTLAAQSAEPLRFTINLTFGSSVTAMALQSTKVRVSMRPYSGDDTRGRNVRVSCRRCVLGQQWCHCRPLDLRAYHGKSRVERSLRTRQGEKKSAKWTLRAATNASHSLVTCGQPRRTRQGNETLFASGTLSLCMSTTLAWFSSRINRDVGNQPSTRSMLLPLCLHAVVFKCTSH